MQLSDEEYFSLLFTLQNVPGFSESQLAGAIVEERRRTGMGFFTTIKLRQPFSPETRNARYWELTFRHKRLPHGGSFMIGLMGTDIFEVEAVAFENSWPEPFVKDDFYE